MRGEPLQYVKLLQMLRVSILSLTVVALSSNAMANNEGPFKGLQIGVGAGVFFPTNSVMQDLFSKSVVNYTFGPVTNNRSSRKGFGFDFTGQGLAASGNSFWSLGVTYGYEWQFGKESDKSSLFFARAGAGPNFMSYDVKSTEKGQAWSGVTALELGAVVNKRVTVSAMYLIYGKKDGLDFSGLRLQFTVGAFKL